MTRQNTWMGIRICSYAAIVFCIAWAVLYLSDFVSILMGKGGLERKVDWSQHTVLKIVFFVLDVISLAITIGLCVKSAINFLKGIRESMVFPQSNVKLFFWLALAYFVHRFCWYNHPIYYHDEIIVGCGHSNFIIPFCILFFAFMYKVAADAVEENNLTI